MFVYRVLYVVRCHRVIVCRAAERPQPAPTQQLARPALSARRKADRDRWHTRRSVSRHLARTPRSRRCTSPAAIGGSPAVRSPSPDR